MKRRNYEPLFTSQPATTQYEQHPFEVHGKRNGVIVITAHWTVEAAQQEVDWQAKNGVEAEVVAK